MPQSTPQDLAGFSVASLLEYSMHDNIFISTKSKYNWSTDIQWKVQTFIVISTIQARVNQKWVCVNRFLKKKKSSLKWDFK